MGNGGPSALFAVALGGLIFGFVVVVVGVVLAVVWRADLSTFGAIRRSKPVPIGQASPNMTQWVQGRAVAGEQGVLQSPLTGRPVLYYRIAATHWAREGGGWLVFHVRRAHRPFFLEDGSGGRARVDLQPGLWDMYAEPAYIGPRSTAMDDPRYLSYEITEQHISVVPPEVMQKHRDRLGDALDHYLRFEERIIAPGETVNVMGRLSSGEGTDGEGSELVIGPTGPGGRDPLIWTIKTDELLRRLGSRRVALWAVFIVGAAILTAGLSTLVVSIT
jgi:hypothetical protein